MRALVLLLWLACSSSAPTPPPIPLPPGATPWPEAVRTAITQAVDKRAPGEPRTRHRDAEGNPIYTNRLVLESSPYLLQHAHNPVDWQPWGDAAFEQARAEDKPVLLSIGYSTCHWCHVMEEESFEDLAIAEQINRDFVAIKVDREERPDLDAVYMRAVVALTGRGGWPMTVVLTPDREPVFAGTYFPARAGDRGATQGLTEILAGLTGRWKDDRAMLMVHAADLSQRMAHLARAPNPTDAPDQMALEVAAAGYKGGYDTRYGGFGRPPKFPRPTELQFLLGEHHRTGDPALRDIVLHTLDAMANGGMRDQIGGGFHRYSTDASWSVPHFEKMLYDQAQLIEIYLEAFQLTGDPRYAQVARDTVDYVLREQRDPDGGFRCATDADSLNPEGERVEGWYFTWTPAELQEVLGDQAALAMRWYAVTPKGNLDGRTVLSTPLDRADLAAELGIEPAALDARLLEIRKKLYQARALRPAPLQDDKVVLGWNALMISALARASFVLDEPLYADAARTSARFTNRKMNAGGRFRRSYRNGVASNAAVLEDYALYTLAMLDLFENTAEGDWLTFAETAGEQVQELFGDDEGGWFETANDAEALLTRGKPAYDGAMPSGNSAAVLAMLRLHALTGRDEYRERADRALSLFGNPLLRQGGSSPLMLTALAFRLSEPHQVVILPGEGAAEMRQVLRTTWSPNKVQIPVPAGLESSMASIPLAADKVAVDGEATAYVCHGGVCERPTTDPTVLRALISEVRTPPE